MPTDTQRNIMDHHHNFASDPEVEQPDEWLSLRDIFDNDFSSLASEIVAFVLLTTLASAIFFITRPKQFEAEGYLFQVPPTVSQEGRSELSKSLSSRICRTATSAHMSKNISAILNNREIQVSPLEIEKKINITRPPKTDLIRILAKDTSADGAVLIAELWIQEYLRSLQESDLGESLADFSIAVEPGTIRTDGKAGNSANIANSGFSDQSGDKTIAGSGRSVKYGAP